MVYANEVKCDKCNTVSRIGSLVKLKDRYCCPKCLHTVKVNKPKNKKENDVHGK